MRTALVAAVASLTLALGACSKSHDSSPYVLNGFDFPVVVKIKTEAGDDVTLTVPARAQARAKVSGMGTVKVTTEAGAPVSENKAQFGKLDRPRGCLRLYNVQGSAAVVEEDVVYGNGFGKPNYALRAGSISDEYCGIRWAFENPPDAISLKRAGPSGANIAWVHYLGDGGWAAAVNALLDDKTEFKSMSRGAAQRIVQSVVTHDPGNAALPAIKARLTSEGLAIPKPQK